MSFLLSFLKFSTIILLRAIRHKLINAQMLRGDVISEEEELLLEAREILAYENDKGFDMLVCECCSVTLSEIREFVKGNIDQLDLDLLKKELKLGSGCSNCVKNFDQWKSKV